jgi:DNA-binding transcriptional regulator YiaG
MAVTDDSLRIAPFESPFTKPGTTTPSMAWPPARRFISTCLLASAMATGTLSVVSSADAEAMRAPIVESRTLSAFAPASTGEQAGPTVPELLQRLRRCSGLNWGEISRALNVSRRTVHNWLSGARIASVHLRHLAALERLIREQPLGSADETRLRLLRPSMNGRSLVDDFALTARPVRQLPISPFSVGDLLTPNVIEEETSASPVRRSSMRGGALRKGRPPGR